MTGAHPGHNRASTHGVRMREIGEGLACGSLSVIERAPCGVPAAASSCGDDNQAAASPTLGEVADLGARFMWSAHGLTGQAVIGYNQFNRL